MRIVHTDRYPDSADTLFATLTDKAFQERKCADAGALSWKVELSRGPDGEPIVKARRKLPSTDFPSMVRKFVPNGASATETVTWAPRADDGSRQADIKIDIYGTPAKLGGTITLRALGDDSCSVTVELVLRVPVPIVGGKVEKLAAPIIMRLVESEERSATAWIAEGRAA
jgi:hypothetical protein